MELSQEFLERVRLLNGLNRAQFKFADAGLNVVAQPVQPAIVKLRTALPWPFECSLSEYALEWDDPF